MKHEMTAVAVGYNFGLVPSSELDGIELKHIGVVHIDGKNYDLSKATTFEGSQKIDTLLDKYGEYQIADYQIHPVIMSGKLELVIPGFKPERDSLLFGGYCFECDGKKVPVDFSGTAWGISPSLDMVTVTFETGRTPLATDFFLDEIYAPDYTAAGLRFQDITAEFLSKASGISEFMVVAEVDGKEMSPEEIARNGRFTLKALEFEDHESVYSMSEEVLDNFNRNLAGEKAKPAPIKEEKENNEISVDTPFGKIVVRVKADTQYPGVYVDLVGPDVNETFENKTVGLALVEFEPQKNKIQTVVYGDGSSEEYTHLVEHKNVLSREVEKSSLASRIEGAEKRASQHNDAHEKGQEPERF